MVTDYKRIDLFGKTFIQKIDLKSPFEFAFPEAEQACFLYMLKGSMKYQSEDDHLEIPNRHSLLLNCIDSKKKILDINPDIETEIVIVTFHPDVLKTVYDREVPFIFRTNNKVTNQCRSVINNDFLIQKYIEGLLFYFENPSLTSEEILILKLQEIVLLLSQTQDAETIQVILSQLFSPARYTFKQIIEAHLFSQAGVQELAEKTNLSVSSFKREFKKIYHDSPGNYIKNRRLERAAELLVISEERISDIAFDCGFNDPANFTKSFHSKYNISPTNYRLENKKG
ncbi:helix-turn-helix domain-containing protein [Chryseobacterium daeguense]|uniref:helix-turn-helix domain-containing protein n=1 Tax=Chryseobacterium daeguense TaxID=412438 RepID=UPI0004059FD0|nr:AraC family transcriptional regulator [Chryseobacterium daeguense]